MSLLPSRPDVTPDGEPRVVGLDSDEAADVIAALSSATARRLLSELHEEPAPAGELADRAETSLQNAQYHLENLVDAGAVEVVGTAYSEKGREMKIYGPADDPLVIFAGEQDRVSGLRAALSRLFGGFAALAVGSLAVQELVGESVLGIAGEDDADPASADPTPTPASDEDADFGAESATPSPEEEPPAAEEDAPDDDTTPTESPDAEAADHVGDSEDVETTAELVETPTPTDAPATPVAEYDPGNLLEGLLAAGVPPGLAFFLGGATVLTVLVAVSTYRTYA